MKSVLNKKLVERSIGYHGQPLQKVWEGEHGEHGEHSLHSLGITTPDYSVYFARQKNFAFHDRAKRLQMHSLIAKKANELFEVESTVELNESSRSAHAGPSEDFQLKGNGGE